MSGEELPVTAWETGYLLVEGPPQSVLEVHYGVADGLAIWQGDIVLGTVEELRRSTAERPHAYRIAQVAAADIKVGMGFKWPSNTIYYTIDPTLPDQARVIEAIAHWEEKTAAVFAVRTNQLNYVYFTSGPGCSSRVGMQGGRQDITLGPRCFRGQAIHEIGHSFGFIHEQCRADRDKYVTINLQNVEDPTPDLLRQFAIVPTSLGKTLGPYDYGSIMHYSDDAFAKPGLKTIVPKDPNAVIGQRVGLSGGDLTAIAERCAMPVVISSSSDQTVLQNRSGSVVQGTYAAGDSSQEWLLKATSFGSYVLVSQSDQKALQYLPDLAEAGTADVDVSDSRQRWFMSSRSDGSVRIYNVAGTPIEYLAVNGVAGDPIAVKTLPTGSSSLQYEWSYMIP